MSVAFTKEESAETASETRLPSRSISEYPNLVTGTGLKKLQDDLREAQRAYDAAQEIEDVNERRRIGAIPLRDVRYYTERVRTARIMPDPITADVIAFGSIVTLSRSDGRILQYRIVGEDEADPKAGSISFASPIARSLMGKSVGDVVRTKDKEIEVLCIS